MNNGTRKGGEPAVMKAVIRLRVSKIYGSFIFLPLADRITR